MENELNRAHDRGAAKLAEEEKFQVEHDECRQALTDIIYDSMTEDRLYSIYDEAMTALHGSTDLSELSYWMEQLPKIKAALYRKRKAGDTG